MLPLESVCNKVFSLFCTLALDLKWSLHISTHFVDRILKTAHDLTCRSRLESFGFVFGLSNEFGSFLDDFTGFPGSCFDMFAWEGGRGV